MSNKLREFSMWRPGPDLDCSAVGKKIEEEYELWSSFFHPPVTSSLLGPNITLSTLLSKTSICFHSLKLKDEVSYPFKITTPCIIPTYNEEIFKKTT
jgi:hypothetical protein